MFTSRIIHVPLAWLFTIVLMIGLDCSTSGSGSGSGSGSRRRRRRRRRRNSYCCMAWNVNRRTFFQSVVVTTETTATAASS